MLVDELAHFLADDLAHLIVGADAGILGNVGLIVVGGNDDALVHGLLQQVCAGLLGGVLQNDDVTAGVDEVLQSGDDLAGAALDVGGDQLVASVVAALFDILAHIDKHRVAVDAGQSQADRQFLLAVILIGVLAAAAGKQTQDHNDGQEQRKKLFHNSSPFSF